MNRAVLSRRLRQLAAAAPLPFRRRVLGAAFSLYQRWIAYRGDGDTPQSLTAADGLPLPPPRLRVLVSGTPDVPYFLSSGQAQTDLLIALLQRHGADVRDMGALLDFGCGCGRLARWWSTLAGPEIHGCDYNATLAAWCREHLPFMQAQVNDLEPPLPYAKQSFDFVYALSIFTHLPDRLQNAWLAELGRVIRPGGHLFLSVHGADVTDRLSDSERKRFDAGRSSFSSRRLREPTSATHFIQKPISCACCTPMASPSSTEYQRTQKFASINPSMTQDGCLARRLP